MQLVFAFVPPAEKLHMILPMSLGALLLGVGVRTSIGTALEMIPENRKTKKNG